jgi:SAM-dependent methyltransferase
MALECERGDLTLRHCRSCSHIWNQSLDPTKLGFDENYNISLYHSPVYRGYVERSIARLNSRYQLRGKTVVEIGCGKGDYLRMLVGAGIGRAIGFDPTFVDRAFTEEEREHITVFRKYYSRDTGDFRPDLVACRSVLQYMLQPREFVASVRQSLGDHVDTVTYFEVPNGAEVFREKRIWHLMYEVGCFFSAASLARLFRECGFEILDICEGLDGACLEIEARPAVQSAIGHSENTKIIADVAEQVEAFPTIYSDLIQKWGARFEMYRRTGKRVVLWAAGMRAISLLVNVPAAADIVSFVVDVNPLRQNHYLPGTAHEIIAPERLPEIRPDVVIVTNPVYATEIRGQLTDLGIQSEFEILA